MEEIKDRKEYVKATMADGIAILEGTATWCSQCKAIAPFVDEVDLHKDLFVASIADGRR